MRPICQPSVAVTAVTIFSSVLMENPSSLAPIGCQSFVVAGFAMSHFIVLCVVAVANFNSVLAAQFV